MPRPLSMADRKQWTTWLVHDQRFVEDRPDVLTYKSAPLDKPLHIKGAPKVDLYAATTGTDADWVVKLIDVAPDTTPEAASQGPSPLIRVRITAGHRNLPWALCPQLFRARAVETGKVENVRFELPHINHVLLPGHRLMVQVQSSLFPLYDRNPQTYVANIFNARASDYKPATQSIQRGGAMASAVLLPIAKD
jgi:putative CocE/NonD family hydrolase